MGAKNKVRLDKTLQELSALSVTATGVKQLAVPAAKLLARDLKLLDCIIVVAGTDYSRARSYGDKPHFLPPLVLSEDGELLVLPESMARQGWQVVGLTATNRRTGWILYRTKRRRELPGQVPVLLGLGLAAAGGYHNLHRAAKDFEERLETTTKQLTHSNHKLVALDETKDEFITMASHQLRTPLTSVKGYLSMVIDGDAGELNEQQKKLLGQAFISAQRMVYLIADLLNVSRLKTGRFVIEAKPIYLPDVVEDEIKQLYEIARAKDITLSFDKPASFPTMELDETKIRQVIMNFVDNALHYTPAGGKVHIELEAKARSIELRVTDTGLGVPRQEQHKLFSKFFRADNARRVRPDGTGLGLFMAKKVIIAQGGAIIFKSREGKGSTFGFIFPLGKS